MGTIYHLTPAKLYDSPGAGADYVPPEFEADGFIHCSADRDQLLRVINTYFSNAPGDFLTLVIDEAALRAEVRYEPGIPEPAPDGELFPHIYGAINRDAISEVHPMARNPDGTFHW